MTATALAAVGLAVAGASGGAILYVDDDALPGGAGPSWANPYSNLQDALADAAGGGVNEIRVAGGVYTPASGVSSCCSPHGGLGCDDAACETAVCGVLPTCCVVAWDQVCADLAVDLCDPLCADPRTETFQLLNGVAVKGGYAGIGAPDPDARDIELYETVLSGDLAGDDGPGPFDNNGENSYTVVTGSGTDNTAILDGVTVSGGNANGPDTGELEWIRGGGIWNLTGGPAIRQCRIQNNYAAGFGGGVYNRNGSSPLLEDCIVTGNVAEMGGGGVFNFGSLPWITGCTFEGNDTSGGSGGGMFNQAGSNLTIMECRFEGNTGISGGGIYNFESSPTIKDIEFVGNAALGGNGGGVRNDNSSPTVEDCTFEVNSAGWGAGMANFQSDPTVNRCTFTNNTADNAGGGMHNSQSDAIVKNCAFIGNQYLIGGGGGGGMINITGSPSIINCLFALNEAPGSAGMTNWEGGNPTLTNCTFVGNVGVSAGGMWSGNNSHPIANNCIFWNNIGPGIVIVSGSTATVEYSDVEGGYAGPGNIDADPLFVDPGNGDYRLSAGSPAIDAGSNSGVPVGVVTDLDGNPRFVDDPCRDDTGLGDPPIVDMGAYEFQSRSCDLDGGGTVGITDFLALLAAWGPCPQPCAPSCPADFDGNCVVGVTDFLILLANWG
ncbi:MAG: right-handed parallel beta-helix repeat-containing protein [Planctomycetota bacterium]|jgi:hypothetical protein